MRESSHSVRTRGVWLAIVLLFVMPTSRRAQAAGGLAQTRGAPGKALAIVVNRSNPVDELSFRDLRKIFLGERSHWPNGRRIAVAMLEYGQPERASILRQVYRMSEERYRDHFVTGMFRGDVFVAPKTLASPVIMRKFVFNAPGAIGYLRSSDVDGSVKVVRIEGRLPDDKDYMLQIDEPAVESHE
jgi:ABC-type phosphate transport system substrate-binding protein